MTLQPLARWLVTFAGFPLGASIANLLVGHVDSVAAAVSGGTITGVVLGAAQGWALFTARRPIVEWALATAVGLAAGLAVGAAIVDFRTGLADLAVQGAVSGGAVGAAQLVVLRGRLGRAGVLWPFWLSAVWTLGWVITTSIGVEVDDQFTVFGSSGAITATLLSAVLPLAVGTFRAPVRAVAS